MKTNTVSNLALAAAFAGLLGGTTVRLNAQPLSGHSGATASSSALAGVLVAEKTDLPKHACKGQNDCKGQGKVHAEALKADRFLAAAELNTPKDGRVPAEMRI